MTMDQLRKAYHTEPFRPFSISLTDGPEFYVPRNGRPRRRLGRRSIT